MEIAALYELYLRHPSVQTDTRRLRAGDIFFALKGASFDGNAFARQALDNGAAYAVVDDPAACAGDARCILVPDVLTTLQELALFHRRQLRIPFIAITGSNGKTTTKELVSAVLWAQHVTYTTAGNLNNHIGVPLTILGIRGDAELAVIEMGANHLNEIAGYCRIALPTHGIITNCGKAHIEGFGSEEGVRKGKGELYDFIRGHDGVIFRNADLDYLREMAHGISRQVTYGAADAQYTGRPFMQDVFLHVALTSPVPMKIATQLVGDYNFANVMTAVAVGMHFGVPPEKIKAAIEAYTPDNSRSQWLQRGSNQVILDAYNANPSSMAAAIRNFAQAPPARKILWLGAMKELGDATAREHEALVQLIRQYTWEAVILVGKEFGSAGGDMLRFDDSAAAASFVRAHRPEHAAILIKGSRGSRMELMLEVL